MQREMMTPSTYEIANAFSAGFAASVRPEPKNQSQSIHWLAGWDSGYELRKVRTEKLNEYLRSIGGEEIALISIQCSDSTQKTLDRLRDSVSKLEKALTATASDWRSYYRIDSKFSGKGPLHSTVEAAESERADMLVDDPGDTITIVMQKMREHEYEILEEHPGY